MQYSLLDAIMYYAHVQRDTIVAKSHRLHKASGNCNVSCIYVFITTFFICF